MRIGVIIPVYNEEKNIALCLKSLLQQTLKPTQIIICDNESTDNSVKIAIKILNKGNIPFHIITVPRNPVIGKLNINFVYWKANKYLREDLDLIACLEAEVILDKKYYENIAQVFKKDPKIGLACGMLKWLGFPKSSFPLSENYKMTWGSNRVYRYSCWLELNKIIDLRFLPSWDTDHNTLTILKGWKVVHIEKAISWHIRAIHLHKGIPRGIRYCCIGYPFWWVIYKSLIDFDPGLIVGYLCMLF